MVVGVAASLSYLATRYTILWFRVDDPLDAVAVHAGGGALGVLATPFAVSEGGVFDADNSVTALHQAIFYLEFSDTEFLDYI